jgi:hypothetical protein
MKLKRFLLRYYPPGFVGFEIGFRIGHPRVCVLPRRSLQASFWAWSTRVNKRPKKSICSTSITGVTRRLLFAQRCTRVLRRSNIDALVERIMSSEPLISEKRKPQLKELIESAFLCLLALFARINVAICVHSRSRAQG